MLRALVVVTVVANSAAHVCHTINSDGSKVAESCIADHDHFHVTPLSHQRLSRPGAASCTCSDGSSPQALCIDGSGCVAVDPGADCPGGGGPTDDTCADTCAPCGASSDDDGGGGGDDGDDDGGDDGSGSDDDGGGGEPSDETCASLSAQGVMSGTSCSPGTCVQVTNPDCDEVTFVNPPAPSTLELCSSAPEDLIWDLFEAEQASPKTCTPVTDAHPICANISGFFGSFNHSFVAAYCNDAFLVLWSHGLYAAGTPACAGYRDHLADVPRPPGVDYDAAGGGGYEAQCVARSARPQLHVYKVPLSPVPLVEDPEEWSTTFFPSSGVGAMLDGLPHYPALDASGLTVWDSCESSLCNTHVGMGFDLHHHGNPGPDPSCFYGAGAAPFYAAGGNTSDDDPHGSPVGLGADGYYMYAAYASAADADPPLDSCGGHSHALGTAAGSGGGNASAWDPNAYHYHPFTTVGTSGVYKFWQGPAACWKGDVAQIPNFYEDESVFKLNYDSSKQCSIAGRSDYDQLRLCDDSSQAKALYYPGYGIPQPCNWFDV